MHGYKQVLRQRVRGDKALRDAKDDGEARVARFDVGLFGSQDRLAEKDY